MYVTNVTIMLKALEQYCPAVLSQYVGEDPSPKEIQNVNMK
jgi:hypothetical protein